MLLLTNGVTKREVMLTFAAGSHCAAIVWLHRKLLKETKQNQVHFQNKIPLYYYYDYYYYIYDY